MSRIAKAPGQPDQRKIYMDWANHYLRKAQFSDVLSDLKDISDGNFLPKIIQAVVHNAIPGVHLPASSEDEKRENIELCVKYLEGTGINCNTFPAKDILEGNMRSILSLFYNLSQFKRNAKSGTGASGASGAGGRSEGEHPPSRIGRAISPGLKSTYGTSAPPTRTALTRSDSDHPPSRIGRPISPGVKSALGVAEHSTASQKVTSTHAGPPSGTTPTTTTTNPAHKPASSPTKSPAANRRTAGSSIMTTTNPYAPRRGPYRSLTIIGGDSKPTIDQNASGNDQKREEEKVVSPKENGSLLLLGDDDDGNDSDNSSVVSESASSSGGRKRSGSSRLQSAAGKGHYGARQRTVSSPHGSKLPSLSSSSSLVGDTTSSSSSSDVHPPQTGSRSGLKQPSSGGRTTPGFTGSGGRTTPSSSSSGDGAGRSGIARPASRFTKPGTIHEKAGANATAKGEESGVTAGGLSASETPNKELHNGESSEQPSKLRLVRKGSDGASKRFKIEAGTSSLPRHLPKGITNAAGSSPATSRLSPLSTSRKHESVAPGSEDVVTSSSSSTGTSNATETNASERLHATESSGDGKRLEGPKRMLKRPGDTGSGSLGSGGGGVHHHTPHHVGLGSPAPATSAAPTTSTERTHPVQKSGGDLLPSRLARVSGGTSSGSGLKPPGAGDRKLQPPQLVTKSRSKATRDYSSSSTSSLDSNGSGGDIVAAKSALVDGGKAGEAITAKKQSGVPTSLNLPPSQRNGETEKADEPPPSKESRTAGSTAPKGRPDCSRRSSPEGMSREEIASSPKAETNDGVVKKTAVEQKNLKNEKELEKGKGTGMGGQVVVINGDLSPEQRRVAKTARDSNTHSISVTSPTEPPNSTTTTTGGKDSRSSSTQGKDRDRTTAPTVESSNKSFSQPETGQPYSDSMGQLSPETKRSAVSFEETETSSEQQPSGSDTPEQEVSPVAKSGSGRLSQGTKLHVHAKRARSLSPKNSRRIFPLTVVPVLEHETTSSQPATPSSPEGGRKMDFNHVSSGLARTRSSGDAMIPAQGLHKPLRSSLRNTKTSGGTSSSSSLDSGNSKSHHGQKVTISPQSSQLIYLPDQAGLTAPPTAYSTNTSFLSPVGHVHHLSASSASPGSCDRPLSLAESTTTHSGSDSNSSLPDCSYGVHHRSRTVDASDLRRISAVSEKLDYHEEANFLRPKLKDLALEDGYGSTPELLESFETQLTTMRRDIESKDRMLNMYETSMADLSSKVHLLRKSLEEKDAEIKHLTDVKTHWYDLDGRSLASRAASEAGVLSDGCLSDSAMDNDGKRGKKKKKPWKRFSFRRKKDTERYHLSPNIETESVISTRSSKSVVRRHSRGKADLMSISEFSPDQRFKDLDTKSNYTLMDNRSEYGGLPLEISEDAVDVYEDSSPGAKAHVVLELGHSRSGAGRAAFELDGYYGDRLGDEFDGVLAREACKKEERTVLGTLSIAPEISWVTMDTKIGDIFMHHINSIDPDNFLGLTEESILYYFIAEQRREIGNALLPPLTPYQAMAGKSSVRIVMKGAPQGSCVSLAYKTLVNTSTLQSYMSMLLETQWLVVMGTKGTCKTSLASGLARHLARSLDQDGEEEEHIVNFNLDKDGMETIERFFKSDLAKRMQHQLQPPIVLLDDVYECEALERILGAASLLHKRPYIISTLCSGAAKGIPLHQLLFHYQIRVVTCNPQNEPIAGILSRTLRKQVYQLKADSQTPDPVAERMLNWLPYLLEHLNTFINKFHSNNVAIGPRVFMNCPLEQEGSEIENWFINLWNHFVTPYLMGTIMAGIETYTADPQLEWIDVREWVIETYPWQPSINIHKLRTLNPEDVGWNHAVRPQQNRFMIIKDDDDTRSVLRIKQNTEVAL